jgi:hypothetical protein
MLVSQRPVHDNNQGSTPEVILVSGEDHLLLRNIAVGLNSGFFDTHSDCAHNRWIANEGAVADPLCILERPLAVSQP